MRIKIITVGKLSLKPIGGLVEEYLGRLRHYLPTEVMRVKQTENYEKHLGPDDFFCVLDSLGKNLSSESFAAYIETRMMERTKHVLFLIGPGPGLPDSIKKKADYLLSLSNMTFQHELTLVLLLEQIYRAGTILKGEPYHKS